MTQSHDPDPKVEVETETEVATEVEILPPLDPKTELRRIGREIDKIRDGRRADDGDGHSPDRPTLDRGQEVLRTPQVARLARGSRHAPAQGPTRRRAHPVRGNGARGRECDTRVANPPRLLPRSLGGDSRRQGGEEGRGRGTEEGGRSAAGHAGGNRRRRPAALKRAGSTLLKEQVADAAQAIAAIGAAEEAPVDPDIEPEAEAVEPEAETIEPAVETPVDAAVAATEEAPAEPDTEPEAEATEPMVEPLAMTAGVAMGMALRMWAELGPDGCRKVFQALGQLLEEAEEGAAMPGLTAASQPRIRVRESVRIN